ncbi:S26 family signal peptidase [Bifidobacterium pseudolongum subsp. globosum]|uniref:signal peptidase I n=1 Tax=Bifidobacterium pseudolongum TaxID=1694 RepID=UPI0010205FDA|nr:signal peptidase I [Bifidobacterium pseudolongum]RYP99493.1 S26 family signal peptidase [Bifidobacterium pseudolongum subsp. globosum]RYQ04029.1 S26 family signal peptidase [Bifidobacterium pseudolongum subsp. globosum]
MTSSDSHSTEPHAEADAVGADAAQTAQEAHHSAGRTILEYLPWIVVPIVVVVLLRMFVFTMYEIPSSSMENTLRIGDRVMVVKPSIAKPERGDIITFKDPGGWLPSKEKKHSDILIKRLIGMPGDTVECEGGGAPIVVNGEPLDESAYLQEGMAPSEIPFSVTVPEGHVFVLGDNRANSADSRYHFHDIGTDGTGTVPMENITGVSKLIYWPFSHWSVTR